jgi:hypothetical protein
LHQIYCEEEETLGAGKLSLFFTGLPDFFGPNIPKWGKNYHMITKYTKTAINYTKRP